MDTLDRQNDATNQDAFWDDMTQGDLKSDDRVKTVATKKAVSKKLTDKEVNKIFQDAVKTARSKDLRDNAMREVTVKEKGLVDRISDGVSNLSKGIGDSISNVTKGIGDGLRETTKETKQILILVAVASFFVSRATK